LRSNGHVYSGTSVIQSTPYGVHTIDGDNGGEKLKGQATVVKLANHVIFILLPLSEQDDLRPARLLLHLYHMQIGSYWDTIGWRILSRQRGDRDIPFDDIPYMVTFSDLKNPNSIKYVDPGNMSGSVGYDLELISASMAVTDEPITKGIHELLPWIGHFNDSAALLCIQNRCISSLDFARGVR
jgi:hypothetical protein